MAETAGLRRDEQAGLWVSVLLLAGMFLLFLLQLPAVMARQTEFSAWLYVPGVLAFGVALWKRADAVAVLAMFWVSLYFMIDVFYGVSFFR
ncbi:MAG TPA: hypothetical protein VGR28_06695 [Candidatus Thermoplasmatota archaeon]|jgi:hypothetical protein|nr:hypothetical protein [Candidatus Thermoplasmatota archaeon]